MSRRNTGVYEIDRQGHLKFSLRSDLIKNYDKRDSGWEHPVASLVVMTVCAVLDFVLFRQLFQSFLYDSPAVQMLSIIGMLVGFDVAPIYAGNILKKRKQGLNASVFMAGIFGAASAMAFIANIVLRITVRDLVLPDFASSGNSIWGGTMNTGSNHHLTLCYALFTMALPVITSLVSFGVSYQTANPLKNRMKKLKEEQIALEDSIVEIEAMLMEYEADPDHFQRILEEDEQKYQNMMEKTHEKTMLYCDYVRERLKEHLGNPTSHNELSRNRWYYEKVSV